MSAPSDIPLNPDEKTDARWAMVHRLVLFGLTIAAFVPSMWGPFISLDDPAYVTANPYVQQGLSWRGAAWAFTTFQAGLYHPLTWLSLMLDTTIFGVEPWGYRLVNILLHAASAVLVYQLLARWSRPAALLVAAAFALHPLRVESVVWISERKDVLAMFLGLMALHAYCGSRLADFGLQPAPARGGLGLFDPRSAVVRAAFWMTLSLLAKPMFVTLPILLAIIDAGRRADRFAIDRMKWWRDWAARRWPLFSLSLAAGITAMAAQRSAGAMNLDVAPIDRLANALVSVVRYLGMTAWPVDLAPFYAHPGSWPTATTLGAAAITVAITAAAWMLRRRMPVLALGWCWFLVALLPMAGLVQVGEQALADRYTYLPGLGLLAMVMCWAPRRMSPLAPLAMTMALATALIPLTWRQIGFWRDNLTLFARTVEVSPAAWLAHHQLANAYNQIGQPNQALVLYMRVIELKPRFAEAHSALGVTWVKLGRIDRALPHFHDALHLDPGHVHTLHNLGVVCSMTGRHDEAMEYFGSAIRSDPGFVPARRKLAAELARARRFDEAVEQMRQACGLRPHDEEMKMDLQRMLQAQAEYARQESNLEPPDP